MSKVSIGLSPVVSIGKVNPTAIIQAVMAGEYSKRPVFTCGNKTLASIESCVVGISNQEPRCVYNYVDGTPPTHTVTTGVDTFLGEIVEGMCWYCKMPEKRKLQYGYCVGITIVNGCTRYLVEDVRMCSPECALGRIMEINLPETTRSTYLKLTRDMLGVYTGSPGPFRVAEDFRLLKENGGTETYAIWSSGKKEYTKLNDKAIVPIKREYIVQPR